MNLLEAIDDPKLFRPWFRDPATWTAWRGFLATLFALPMDEEALATYRACTGRSEPPAAPFEEAWLIVGRRGGKTSAMALIGTFLATFRDYRPYLAPGERATIPLIAADRRQARTLARYIRALLLEVPMLRRMVQADRADGFDLTNRSTVEIHTASYRSVRGYTLAILAALRPGLASIPGSMLLCGSSPHAKRGELWRAYRQFHGQDGAPVLTWQADTRTMNPNISERVIAEAYERDPARAAAEYGAQFRSDVESYISRELIEAAIDPGCRVRAPLSAYRYAAFIDPSGGASDSMTMAVAHAEKGRAMLDCVVERRAPFSPEAVTEEFSATLKAYRVSTVRGDRYAGEWPRESFRRHGIRYEPAEMAKSQLYVNLLPILTSGRADLVDEPRLVAQLAGLERRTARGGRESIDHAPGSHDDVANAVAGALVLVGAARCNGPMSVPIRGLA